MTTQEDVVLALQQYRNGSITLGDFFAILSRFLDITEEVPAPEPPPAPAPAPEAAKAPAKEVKK